MVQLQKSDCFLESRSVVQVDKSRTTHFFVTHKWRGGGGGSCSTKYGYTVFHLENSWGEGEGLSCIAHYSEFKMPLIAKESAVQCFNSYLSHGSEGCFAKPSSKQPGVHLPCGDRGPTSSH